MRRIFTLCILSLLLIGLTTSSGHSQNAAEILEKMIEAQGGRKLLENIKDTTISSWWGTAEKAMGTTYKKEPNKIRKDFDGMTYGFDGESAWYNDLFIGKKIEVQTEADKEILKREALGYSALLHPEKYGVIYAYKGKEEIEGKYYFVLEQTFDAGLKTTLYVDTETYLIYRTNYAYFAPIGEKIEVEMFMSDYKNVGGVMIPHSRKDILKGYGRVNTLAHYTITKVSFNTGLDDSLFDMNK